MIGTGVGFFLVPILTRYLTPADYGIVANYTALLLFISYFICLGNNGYLFRNFFFLDKYKFANSLSNTFLVNGLISFVFLIILIIFYQLIDKYLLIPLTWLIFLPFIAIGQIFIDTSLSIFQAQGKAKNYSLLQLSQTILNLGLSILFVVFLMWNWEGRLAAQVITALLLGTLGFSLLKKNYNISSSYKSIDVKEIKDFLNFGVPLIPHFIGGFVLSMSDRLFISTMVGVEATGLYTVGATFGGLMMILHGAFYRVYLPYAFERLRSSNESSNVKSKLVKITYFYIAAFIILSIILYFGAALIFPWFVGPKFESAYIYVLWISLGYAMLSAYQMFSIYVIYTKKTNLVSFRTDFLAAVVKIPLTYFLILAIGPIGAAVATFFAFLITAISSWYINNKAFPMPWFSLIS